MAEITTASGLVYEDTVVGEGTEAVVGNYVTVHYTGWLTDGSKFGSRRSLRISARYAACHRRLG